MHFQRRIARSVAINQVVPVAELSACRLGADGRVGAASRGGGGLEFSLEDGQSSESQHLGAFAPLRVPSHRIGLCPPGLAPGFVTTTQKANGCPFKNWSFLQRYLFPVLCSGLLKFRLQHLLSPGRPPPKKNLF